MGCSGFEPTAAKWKAQTNPLGKAVKVNFQKLKFM